VAQSAAVRTWPHVCAEPRAQRYREAWLRRSETTVTLSSAPVNREPVSGWCAPAPRRAEPPGPVRPSDRSGAGRRRRLAL